MSMILLAIESTNISRIIDNIAAKIKRFFDAFDFVTCQHFWFLFDLAISKCDNIVLHLVLYKKHYLKIL